MHPLNNTFAPLQLAFGQDGNRAITLVLELLELTEASAEAMTASAFRILLEQVGHCPWCA
jgi:hypothetical protein